MNDKLVRLVDGIDCISRRMDAIASRRDASSLDLSLMSSQEKKNYLAEKARDKGANEAKERSAQNKANWGKQEPKKWASEY
jgi:hypothetical protein